MNDGTVEYIDVDLVKKNVMEKYNREQTKLSKEMKNENISFKE